MKILATILLFCILFISAKRVRELDIRIKELEKEL